MIAGGLSTPGQAARAVSSPVSRVLANFYFGISHPRLPIRLFTAEDEALEWLREHIE